MGFKINVRRFIVRIGITHDCFISWMCQERSAVSHGSAEYEIISLDAGLRMDGSSALQLVEYVLETFSRKIA